jgi:hypothetical protein
MALDWALLMPSFDEVVIVDVVAAQAAVASLGPDVTILGYEMSSPEVLLREEKKIVRILLKDKKHNKTVGIAIRVYDKENIDEAIEIFK